MTSVPVPSDRPSRLYGAGTIIVDKYELVRPLGEGGMGTVWVARNLALQSHVALKLLRADVTDEDAGERMLQEARVAARLDHSAIVRVFDFGQTPQGDPFIVMDLVEGETLAALLAARGRLAPVKAVQILLPVLDALATAHAHGIVHRDLKPENILLAREAGRTQPKIVDFGIAKADLGMNRETLTRRGVPLGSPGYMAPEQARGSSSTDARTDVWAICVVLYECITGRLPFQGENYNALMRAIVEDDVVPITEVAAGDAELWTILQRGLQKDPAARWLSGLELGKALAEWLMRHEVDVDISGDRLSAWVQPDSSKPRDLLSAPPAPLGPTASGRRTLAGSVQANQPRSFRTAAFIATIILLILGATVAITVTRTQTSAVGPSASPLPDTTTSSVFEPTAATTSAPSAPASAIVSVETPDQTSAEQSAKPKPAPRAVPVPKKTKAPVSGAAPSDLKNPY